MANNVVTIPIWTVTGTTPVMVSTGSYDLRVSPYSSTGIAGTHIGGGIWGFTGLSDIADYKLYNTVAGTEVTGLTGGGTNTRVFFDGDLQNYIRHNGSIAFTANQAMGGFKFTGAGAATETGQFVRWDEAIMTTGTQTKAGQLIFNTTGSIVPTVSAPGTTGLPTASGHLTSKQYVDTLFSGVVGVVQSTFLNKLIPLRTVEDIYSHTTMELCNAYLAALVSANTKRGVMLIEPLGANGNIINADDGTSAWVSDRVDITGIGRPVINRRAPNSSLTCDSKITGCHIVDGAAGVPVVSARAYTNFTFENCTFDLPDDTDITFTTCKFIGLNRCKSDGGATITLASCTGDMFWYNDTVNTFTISGATQPDDVRAVLVANFNY